MVPVGKHSLALCFAILILSAGQGGNACPTSVSTLADMKSGIDCGGDVACTLTAPELTAYTFDDPAVRITDIVEPYALTPALNPAVCSAAFLLCFGQHTRDDSRPMSSSPLPKWVFSFSLPSPSHVLQSTQQTNAALGSTGTFTVTLKCGTIDSSGCTGAACVGCAGTVTRTVTGTADPGNTCDTTEADGSATSYTVTGGGDCAATAVCSDGFYDGGTFTAATGSTAVDLVKISLMKDSSEHDAVTGLSAASTNGYLIGHDSTSSVTDGVVSITGLKIVKTAAFTNAFTLDFVAIGSGGNTVRSDGPACMQ